MVTSLGQRLRAAREKRGLSLEDAVHQTRIPAFRLKHLESDNYAAFGSMTYARAFLKLYSRFLGVDASEILTDLPPSRLGGRRDYRYLVEQYGRWVPERRQSFADLPAWSFRNPGARSPFATAAAAFIAVLIAAGFWGGHVAGERAEMASEQEKLEQDLGGMTGSAGGAFVMPKPMRAGEAVGIESEPVPMRAIPVNPAEVSTILREQLESDQSGLGAGGGLAR